MGKRLYAIWSILLVLVVSIAILGLGCGGGGCTVEVKATLCGAPWPTQGTGAVSYTLMPGTGTSINGTSVPATHSADCGNWTCGNVSGGPANAFLDKIAPSANQTVSDGGTITFTLEFEENQDAWITFDTWTRKGEDWEYEEVELFPCDWLDIHFQQGVLGCDGYQATVNETSRLTIMQTGGPGGVVQIFVVNDDCALNKTPAPIQKVSQVPSFDGEPAEVGENVTLNLQQVVTLDVETVWKLVKETEYTKSINWFGVSVGVPEPGHDCVLFELVVPPGAAQYTFQLTADAEVALVDDDDSNVQNDKTQQAQLTLTVTVLG
jgi:hypothetical protein